MKRLSCFVKLRCTVLLWIYFLLLLQLCAMQTVATSLYYTHLTKDNMLPISLFFHLWLSITQKQFAR